MKHEVLNLISLWIIFNHDYLNKFLQIYFPYKLQYLGEKLMITHISILTAFIKLTD